MALVVAVEGLPGCGKTTVIQVMMEDLRGRGFKVEMVDIETLPLIIQTVQEIKF